MIILPILLSIVTLPNIFGILSTIWNKVITKRFAETNFKDCLDITNLKISWQPIDVQVNTWIEFSVIQPRHHLHAQCFAADFSLQRFQIKIDFLELLNINKHCIYPICFFNNSIQHRTIWNFEISMHDLYQQSASIIFESLLIDI